MGACAGSKELKKRHRRESAYQEQQSHLIDEIKSIASSLITSPFRCTTHPKTASGADCTFTSIDVATFKLICSTEESEQQNTTKLTLPINIFFEKFAETAMNSKPTESAFDKNQTNLFDPRDLQPAFDKFEKILLKIDDFESEFQDQVVSLFVGFEQLTKNAMQTVLSENCEMEPTKFAIKKKLVAKTDSCLAFYAMLVSILSRCSKQISEWASHIDILSSKKDTKFYLFEEIDYERASGLAIESAILTDQLISEAPICPVHFACHLERMDTRSFRVFCSEEPRSDLQVKLEIVLNQLQSRELKGRIGFFKSIKTRMNSSIKELKSSTRILCDRIRKQFTALESAANMKENLIKSVHAALVNHNRKSPPKPKQDFSKVFSQILENQLVVTVEKQQKAENKENSKQPEYILSFRKPFVSEKKLTMLQSEVDQFIRQADYAERTSNLFEQHSTNDSKKDLTDNQLAVNNSDKKNNNNNNPWQIFLKQEISRSNLTNQIDFITVVSNFLQSLDITVSQMPANALIPLIIPHIKSINRLAVKWNNCGRDGANEIARLIGNLTAVEYLFLDFKNDGITAEGLLEVLSALQRRAETLRVLRVNLEQFLIKRSKKCFSECKLKQCGFLAERIGNLTQLHTLELKVGMNLFLPGQIVEVLFSLKSLHHLNDLSLDLQNCKVDSMCLKVFSESLEGKILTKLNLNLCNCSISPSELSFWNIDQLIELEDLSLNLSSNALTSNSVHSFLLAIASIQKLNALALILDRVLSDGKNKGNNEQNQIDSQSNLPSGFVSIFKAMSTTLTSLHVSLCENQLTPSAFTEFASSLHVLTALKSLKLSFWSNNIDEQAFSSVSRAIQSLQSLTCLHLDFQWNEITSVRSLSRAILQSSRISELYLNFGSNRISDENCIELLQQIEELRNLTILRVDVSSNQLTYSTFASCIQLLERISSSIEEVSFNLQDNNLAKNAPSATVINFSNPIKRIKILNVDLSSTNIDNGIIVFTDILRNCMNSPLTDLSLNFENCKVYNEQVLENILDSLRLIKTLRNLKLGLRKITGSFEPSRIASHLPSHSLRSLTLELGDSKLGEQVETMVREILAQQKELRYLMLDLWKNNISIDSVERIIATLTDEGEGDTLLNTPPLVEFSLNLWENDIPAQQQTAITKSLAKIKHVRGNCIF